MRIVHYIPSIDRTSGGVGSYMKLIAGELGKLVDLHIVTHRTDSMYNIPNCTIHYISEWNSFMRMKREWIFVLDAVTPDVVHVNGCWTPSCAMVQRWAQKRGYRVVLTPHGMLEPWIIKRHYWTRKFPALLLYQKAAIKHADIIHATAESERCHLLQLGWNRNIEVIPNCVQVEKIVMKESWRRKKEVLFLSRVHVKKGINFLIEAVAKINEEYTAKKEECPISRCIIAGEGEDAYIDELRDMSSCLGVGHIMDFIGGVYGERKWELFKQADLFVLPTHSENFGIVVAEALACGTPVVTTKGTPWQELEECNCGWWTDIGTTPMVEALKEFMSLSEEQIEQMGRHGRKLIEDKYSSFDIAKKMQSLYKDLQKCNHLTYRQ